MLKPTLIIQPTSHWTQYFTRASCALGAVHGAEILAINTTETHEFQGMCFTREDRKEATALNRSEWVGGHTSWQSIDVQDWRPLVGNELGMLVKRKRDYRTQCSYKGKNGERGDQEADNTEPVGHNKASWFNSGYNGNPQTVGTREQCSGYHFETISMDVLQWQTLGREARKGRREGLLELFRCEVVGLH